MDTADYKPVLSNNNVRIASVIVSIWVAIFIADRIPFSAFPATHKSLLFCVLKVVISAILYFCLYRGNFADYYNIIWPQKINPNYFF